MRPGARHQEGVRIQLGIVARKTATPGIPLLRTKNRHHARAGDALGRGRAWGSGFVADVGGGSRLWCTRGNSQLPGIGNGRAEAAALIRTGLIYYSTGEVQRAVLALQARYEMSQRLATASERCIARGDGAVFWASGRDRARRSARPHISRTRRRAKASLLNSCDVIAAWTIIASGRDHRLQPKLVRRKLKDCAAKRARDNLANLLRHAMMSNKHMNH